MIKIWHPPLVLNSQLWFQIIHICTKIRYYMSINYCQKTTYSCCPNRLERKAAHSHTEFTMNGTEQSVNHKLVSVVFEPIPFVCSFLAKASKAEQLMNATQESVNHLYF